MEAPTLAIPTSASRSVALPRRRPTLPIPRAVLCDLDGTLIDTMPTLANLAAEVMAEAYRIEPVLARELYLSTCGLPFFQQLEAIFPGDARNPKTSDIFETRKPALCRAARMPAETQRALTALRERGVRIAVSSNNGQDNVDAFADSSEFPFDLVLGFGAGLAKGEPHISAAERAFALSRGEMLFVGDSLHDGEIAENERIPFVGVAGTFSKERFTLRFPHRPVVHRFAEIVALFE